MLALDLVEQFRGEHVIALVEPFLGQAVERVDVTRTGDLETDVTALTAELAHRLEKQVRIAPEQYFWFHKRWKNSRQVEVTK